jgi:hypothetical protein
MKEIKSLTDIVGTGWKVTLDECFKIEKSAVTKGNKIWYEQIKCRKGGWLALFDSINGLLMLFTPRTKLVNKMVEAIPDLKLREGEGEVTVFFPYALGNQVLKFMGGARKKVYSEEVLQKARERMTRLHAEGKIGKRIKNP